MNRDQVLRARNALTQLNEAMQNIAERSQLYDDVRQEDIAFLRTAWQAFNAAIWDHVVTSAFKTQDDGR